MDKEHFLGPMEDLLLENGKMVKWMVLLFILMDKKKEKEDGKMEKELSGLMKRNENILILERKQI